MLTNYQPNNKAVCQGAIAEELPIIARDLRNMNIGSETSKKFCIAFFGLCPYPDIDQWNIPFTSAKPSGGRPAPSGQTPIQIVHFSDIHIDPMYVDGANANCTDPICCRSNSGQTTPANQQVAAGPNGDHKCDAPISLEESLYSAIKGSVPNAAFALFTGDIVDHAVWSTTVAQNTIDIQDAYTRMGSLGMPVYGALGNHEMSPTNLFEPTSQGSASQWIYNLASQAWSPWVGAPGQSGEAFGAYAYQAAPNLKVISINTNLWYIQNYYLYVEPMEQDPSGQLAWLISELDAAEKAGQHVYIIGHTPQGESDALRDQSHYFDQIVNRYSATIAAMFWGHTHFDHFEVSYSDYTQQNSNTASMAGYICPSLTPTSGHPAFRVYTVDPVTWAVLDAETYLADMSNPAFQSSGPVWTKEYSAKAAYGPLVSPPLTDPNAELSPAFWHNVTTVFAANSNAFQQYWGWRTRGWEVPWCDAACQAKEICQLRAGRSESNCNSPSPGLQFRKRDLEATNGKHAHDHGHFGPECGHSALGDLVRDMLGSEELFKMAEAKLEMK
jgi:sphingomyelin phosphodiesterase